MKTKFILILAILAVLFGGVSIRTIYTPAGATPDPLLSTDLPIEIINEIRPLQGVHIVPLSEQNVPDAFRSVRADNIYQMKTNGYIEVKRLSNNNAEIQKSGKRQLKPLNELRRNLAIEPSKLTDISQKFPDLRMLGARQTGSLVDGKSTGIFHLMVVPELGLVGLNEVDYMLSNGGISLIEEAINYNVNGKPAVLTVKRTKANDGESELIWATDRKIYPLTTDRAVVGRQSVNELIAFANSITD